MQFANTTSSVLGKLVRVITLIASAGGVWVCAGLLSAHDGGWNANPNGALLGLCGPVGPGDSCADVTGSRWGAFDFFVGTRRIEVPTSLIGLTYFLGAILWQLFLGPLDRTTQRVRLASSFLAILGLAGSAVFIAIMRFDLQNWCLGCVMAHVFNGVMVAGIAWQSWRRLSVSEAPSTGPFFPRNPQITVPARNVWLALSTTSVLAVGSWMYLEAIGVSRSYWRKSAELEKSLAELQADGDLLLRLFDALPMTTASPDPTPDTSAVHAVDDTGERLVVFVDHDCYRCRCADARLRDTISKLPPGTINLEYRYFPRTVIDSSEKPTDTNWDSGFGPSFAAEAARTLGGREAFLRLHELLLATRSGERDFADLAAKSGLEPSALWHTIHDKKVTSRVLNDIRLGESLGVRRTPTLYLNNRRVPDLCASSTAFWQAFAERARTETKARHAPQCGFGLGATDGSPTRANTGSTPSPEPVMLTVPVPSPRDREPLTDATP